MNVLFLTANFPYPPTDGAKIRIFSLIRHLAKRHRIKLISFIRTTEKPSAVEGMYKYCHQVWAIPRDVAYKPGKLLRGLVGTLPFPVVNYWDRSMARLVNYVTNQESFDIVQAESLEMVQYTFPITDRTVLDLHNIESELMMRYAKEEPNLLKRAYANITSKKLAAYENKMCRQLRRCLTCSEEDRQLLQKRTGVEHIDVVPNGVDLDNYSLNGSARSSTNRIVFVGRMDYHANVSGIRWFFREVLPNIRAQWPNIVFQIVGGNPTEEVRKMARPGEIEVTGAVDDVRPYLREASAVVVPLKVGGGTRLKILEALAMGKAVVSTSIGAEGLRIDAGTEVLIADRPEQFAEETIRVLANADLRESLGKAGRQLVERLYSWETIGQRLESIYETVATSPQSREGSLSQ
jgi:sugar transferase (PEP-CTERM/EpsH1 system associated)